MEVEENSGRKLKKGMECSKYDGVVLCYQCVLFTIRLETMRNRIQNGFVSEGG
jgi:hypothetical protein